MTVNLGNCNMLLISKPGLGTAYLLPMTGHIEVVVNLPSGKFIQGFSTEKLCQSAFTNLAPDGQIEC